MNPKRLRSAESSTNKNKKNEPIIRYGEVVFIDDEFDAGRIKVKIKNIDDKYDIPDIPYCYPFLPKFFSVMPKLGEMVKVIFLSDNNYKDREWIGPVISQLQNLNKENYSLTAFNLTDTPRTKFLPAISRIKNADKVYPNKEDIAIQGRNNTDIILKDREVLIRVGKHDYNNNITLNKKNPSYIQLKMFDNDVEKSTHVNIFSDYINLISHKNDGRKINPVIGVIGDVEKQIKELEENLSPMVRGDKLVEFLELLKQYVQDHIHNGARIPSDNSGSKPKIEKFDLTSILSKNIRIN